MVYKSMGLNEITKEVRETRGVRTNPCSSPPLRGCSDDEGLTKETEENH